MPSSKIPTRTIIIASLFLPAFCLFSVIIFVQLYEAPHLSGKLNFIKEDFDITSVDGISLKATHLTPVKKEHPPLVLFLGDPHLDRNWNTTAFDFHSGRWLASALASFGIASIRYDPRGIGESKASLQTKHDFSIQAADLKSAYQAAKKQNPSSLYILAHGDYSCHLALHASERWQFKVNGFILLACGGTDNLLNLWAKKIFANMEHKGTHPSIIEQAQKQWKLWPKSNHLTKFSKNNSDLNSFQSALHFLQNPALKSFRKIAPKLYLLNLIRLQAKQGRSILHIMARYDGQRNQSMQSETRKLVQKLQSLVDLKQNYSFHELQKADHFLKTQNTQLHGLRLTLSHVNPLRGLEDKAIRLIKDWLYLKSPK